MEYGLRSVHYSVHGSMRYYCLCSALHYTVEYGTGGVCIQYTVYSVQYTVYSIQYTVYSVQYTAHYTLYLPQQTECGVEVSRAGPDYHEKTPDHVDP